MDNSTANNVFRATLFATGIINTLPVIGVLGNKHLESLYGIRGPDNNVSILLRHRAVLFGLVGGFMQYAAVMKPEMAPAATIGGLASMLSYIAIAKQTGPAGGYSEKIDKVVLVDLGASVALGAAGLLQCCLGKNGKRR
jgi:hypothetical protein